MEYWLDSAEVAAHGDPAEGLRVRTLFGEGRGCRMFEQRLLEASGDSGELREEARDDVLYVLSGEGVAVVAGERHGLAPGAGVFVSAGTPWSVEGARGLRLLSVLVREPLPAGAAYAVVEGSHRAGATAGRGKA